MGAAVGQVPEYIEMVVRWCKLTRASPSSQLTPNITTSAAVRAAKAAAPMRFDSKPSTLHLGRPRHVHARALIGVKGAWRYSGPSVKADRTTWWRDRPRPETRGLHHPASRGDDVAQSVPEFLAQSPHVQVCTAAMTTASRSCGDDRGLENWMDDKCPPVSVRRLSRATPNVTAGRIQPQQRGQGAHRPEPCIKCGRCHIACEDTSPQAITACGGRAHFEVMEDECVAASVRQRLPGEGCITMCRCRRRMDLRTGQRSRRSMQLAHASTTRWPGRPRNIPPEPGGPSRVRLRPR